MLVNLATDVDDALERLRFIHSNTQRSKVQASALPVNRITEFLPSETLAAAAPPVPTTALYTRGDGVVAWQSTVELSERYDVENIHVGGAHLGLGFNPRVLVALADRLAQPEGQWRRFKPPFWMRPFYHNWYPDWLVHGNENPLESSG